MSEYTPTTEQVRLAARDQHANRVSGPAFDRWLAAEKARWQAEGAVWRQLMRDHEAVVKERDELEAEVDRLQTALRRKENHRARAREQVRQRDEVIERVRSAVIGRTIPYEVGAVSLVISEVVAALEGDGR